MPKVHQRQTATILAISGRRVTVDANGNTADYMINRTAKITLNDQKAKLADLENGDEVEFGGISKTGVDQVRATRPEGQLPKSVTPNTTDHFPPTSEDESVALKAKADEEHTKQQLREGANLTNKPAPSQSLENRNASDPDLPSGDKSTSDDDTKASSVSKPFSPTVPHPRKRSDK